MDISNNNLKDLNGLQYAELKQLKILKADHNEISKLDSLDGLEQLKELDLNNNKIRQFEMYIYVYLLSFLILKPEIHFPFQTQ